MFMNGNNFSPYHYDPWTFMMMSSMMNQKKEEDTLKDEDIVRLFKKYQDLKKEFEPPKKDDKKDEHKWEVGDYFVTIIAIFGIMIPVSAYLILAEIIKLAEVLHK